MKFEQQNRREKSGTGRAVVIYVQVFWSVTDLWIRIGVQVPQCGCREFLVPNTNIAMARWFSIASGQIFYDMCNECAVKRMRTWKADSPCTSKGKTCLRCRNDLHPFSGIPPCLLPMYMASLFRSRLYSKRISCRVDI